MNHEQRKELYALFEEFGTAVDERDNHTSLVFNDASVCGPSTNALDDSAWRLFAFVEDLLEEQENAHYDALNDAYNNGRADGHDEAYNSGREAGYDDGYQAGYEAGGTDDE